jgi:hypothetical protein
MTTDKKYPHFSYLLDWSSIVSRKLTKRGLASHHYPPQKYTTDDALPQAWLNQVASESDSLDYQAILHTVVWLYPGKSEAPAYWLCGIPAVLCDDTAQLLARLEISHWTPQGLQENENE